MRRLVDDPDALTGSDRRHYTDCPACQARSQGMADDARVAATMLAAPELKLDVADAFKRVQAAPAARPRFGFSLPILRPSTRPMFAGLGAAAIILALAVTAFANILPLFQPKTVQPVPVSFADLQSLSSLSAYGTVTWSTQPQPQVVLTAADAKAISGLNVPVVAKLPAGVSSTVTYAAMPEAVAVFTFDAQKAAGAAAATGKPLPKLPSGMDGAKLTVTVGPAVIEVFGDINGGSGTGTSSQDISLPQVLIVARSAVPVVTSTQVTAKQLEDYILAMPGLSPELASAIRSIGDPTTTLPIPVPVGYASSTKVSINGDPGVALGDNTGLGSGVVWIHKTNVFVVAGPVKQSAVLDIARNLK
ncbi:MAG TPA: hypothetical protein VF956_06530 [Candidatus Dormibacteraeota bacterium]